MQVCELREGSSIKFKFIGVPEDYGLVEAGLRVIENYGELWPKNHRTVFYIYDNNERFIKLARSEMVDQQIFEDMTSDDEATCVVRPKESYIKLNVDYPCLKTILGHELTHIPQRFVEMGGAIYNIAVVALPVRGDSCLTLSYLQSQFKRVLGQITNIIDDYSSNNLYPGPKEQITLNAQELCDDISKSTGFHKKTEKEYGRKLYTPFNDTTLVSDMVRNCFDGGKLSEIFRHMFEIGVLDQYESVKYANYSRELLSELGKIKERTNDNYVDVMLGMMGIFNKYESLIQCMHGEILTAVLPVHINCMALNGTLTPRILADINNREELKNIAKQVMSKCNTYFANRFDCANSLVFNSDGQ